MRAIGRNFGLFVMLSTVACHGSRATDAQKLDAPIASSPAASAAGLPTASAPNMGTPVLYVYEGMLAKRRILLRVHCQATCSGYYFYEAIGETLRLAQVAPNTFDELLGVGSKSHATGHFAFDAPPGADTWQGTWTAAVAAGKSSEAQHFVLARVVRDAAPRSFKRVFEEASLKDPDCQVTIKSFEIVGLANALIEDRINATFEPAKIASENQHIFSGPADASEEESCGNDGSACDESIHGYRVLCRALDGRSGLFLESELHPTVLDATLLSVRDEYGFDGGGVHPSDGVSGATIDLRDGHLLDARDLLLDPAHEPKWSSFVSSSFKKNVGDDVSFGDITFALGVRPDPSAAPVWEKLDWTDFYLTPTGFALVPGVPEVARIWRHDVQEVPFTKVRSALLPTGPAAHLYLR